MIAGRSGTQKSGLALYWVAEMALPTLYLSADMNAATASKRLASMKSGEDTTAVEWGMANGQKDKYVGAVEKMPLTFSFGQPITWRQIDEELESWVHLWDCYPSVIVVDNLMDFDGAESDYTEQMAVMQGLTELARETGATILVLHHASDKTMSAQHDPWRPPARNEIKNGLAEKPEMALTVSLDPNTLIYRVACVKQRSGPCDQTARTYTMLRAIPSLTRFTPFD